MHMYVLCILIVLKLFNYAHHCQITSVYIYIYKQFQLFLKCKYCQIDYIVCTFSFYLRFEIKRNYNDFSTGFVEL